MKLYIFIFTLFYILDNGKKNTHHKNTPKGIATKLSLNSITILIREINAEALARQDKILHELEMLQTVYNLKFITNN